MSENKVSQPPIQISMVDNSGKPSKAWAIWFRDLYRRTAFKGGNAIDDNATSGVENQEQITALDEELTETILDVVDNATDITTNTNNITTNSNDILTNANNIGNEITRATTEEARIYDILKTQYQCLKTATQSTTAVYSALLGWSESKNVGGFTLNSGNGTIAITNTGEYEFSAWVMGDDTGSNRTQLEIQLQVDPLGVGSFADVSGARDTQYINRDVTIYQGSAQINNFQISLVATDLLRIRVKHVGVASDIFTNNARMTLRRIS